MLSYSCFVRPAEGPVYDRMTGVWHLAQIAWAWLSRPLSGLFKALASCLSWFFAHLKPIKDAISFFQKLWKWIFGHKPPQPPTIDFPPTHDQIKKINLAHPTATEEELVGNEPPKPRKSRPWDVPRDFVPMPVFSYADILLNHGTTSILLCQKVMEAIFFMNVEHQVKKSAERRKYRILLQLEVRQMLEQADIVVVSAEKFKEELYREIEQAIEFELEYEEPLTTKPDEQRALAPILVSTTDNNGELKSHTDENLARSQKVIERRSIERVFQSIRAFAQLFEAKLDLVCSH
jgi:hypothetical protein